MTSLSERLSAISLLLRLERGPEKRIRAHVIGHETGAACGDQRAGCYRAGLRAREGDRRRVAAFLAGTPETGKAFQIRHFQIKRDGIKHRELVCQLDALRQARRAGDADIRVRPRQMPRRKVTTEAVFLNKSTRRCQCMRCHGFGSKA